MVAAALVLRGMVCLVTMVQLSEAATGSAEWSYSGSDGEKNFKRFTKSFINKSDELYNFWYEAFTFIIVNKIFENIFKKIEIQ